jgi:hypothetical protein
MLRIQEFFGYKYLIQCKYRNNKQTYQLRGLSPRANYTDRATAACRRS